MSIFREKRSPGKIRVTFSAVLDEWWGAEEAYEDGGPGAVVELVKEDLGSWIEDEPSGAWLVEVESPRGPGELESPLVVHVNYRKKPGGGVIVVKTVPDLLRAIAEGLREEAIVVVDTFREESREDETSV